VDALLNSSTRRPAKSVDAVALFTKRLKEGAYVLRGIPGERKLATELGVSYLSARKVVGRLIEANILQRTPNGRLVHAPLGKKGQAKLQIAYIAPAFASQTLMDLHRQVSFAVGEIGGTLRPISYLQASDPVVFEALDASFDGIFIILPIGAPQLLLDRLERHRHRVVSLLQNVSHLGIPSFVPAPAPFITILLDHLVSLGHRRIDCFNTMPHDSVIDDRIRHWRMGIEQRGLAGELHDFPTAAFECSTTAAYHRFGKMIDGGLGATAFICVTAELGRGVIRACHEHGVRVGHDVSICGFSEDRVARLTVPSLTTVAEADAQPFLKLGLEWIQTGGKDWRRPLLLQPETLQLFAGESSGPCES
jgi:hypothetical protein